MKIDKVTVFLQNTKTGEVRYIQILSNQTYEKGEDEIVIREQKSNLLEIYEGSDIA